MRRHAPINSHSLTPGTLVIRQGRIRKRYVALLVVLLLVGWLGWSVYRAVTAQPGPLVDYGQRLLDMSAQMQPEGENGWPYMVDALEQLENLGVPDRTDWPSDRQKSEDVRSLYRVLEGPYDTERLKFELAYLDSIRESGVLELLDQFAACPRAVRPDFATDGGNGLLFVILPELSRARQMAKARVAAMRVAAENGDMEELVRAWTHTIRLAHAMSYDPVFISHLVGIAIMNLGCQELERLLVEFDLDEETCRELQAVLSENPVLAPMAAVLERERISQYDIIQHTHSDDGNGDGILLVGRLEEYAGLMSTPGLSPGGSHPIYNVAGLLLPSRAETTRTVDEFFDLCEEQAGMPRVERSNQSANPDAYVEQLPRLQLLLRMTLPALSRAVINHDLGMSVLEATRVQLAIEAFEVRNGRLPSTLDDLSPDFLDQVPIDAVSCQPFVYVQRQPTADDPRRFWLYSIGVDGVDDGGVEATGTKEGPIRAMRDGPSARGFDYIFNRLRDPATEEQEDAEVSIAAPAEDEAQEAPATSEDSDGR